MGLLPPVTIKPSQIKKRELQRYRSAGSKRRDWRKLLSSDDDVELDTVPKVVETPTHHCKYWKELEWYRSAEKR